MTTGIIYFVKMNPEGLMSPNLDLNKDITKTFWKLSSSVLKGGFRGYS
jgi:hypothetical protein